MPINLLTIAPHSVDYEVTKLKDITIKALVKRKNYHYQMRRPIQGDNTTWNCCQNFKASKTL